MTAASSSSVFPILKMAMTSLISRQGLSHIVSCKHLLERHLRYKGFPIKDLIELVQKCRKHRINEFAGRLYTFICSNGLETHERLGNFLVPMLVDCGSVLYAQQVFHKLIDQNECSWTSLMQGYLDSGEDQRIYELFQRMQETSIRPSKFTVQVLLRACTRLKYLQGIHGAHSYFVEDSYDGDLFVGNALIHTYASCGWLAEAACVFDRLSVQDVVSWTTLIAGYAEHDFITESLHCWEHMQVQAVFPNAFTAASAIAACGSIEALGKGQEIHVFVTKVGFEQDSFVGNALVDFYGKCGRRLEAQEVFHKLPAKDEFSWTALITGYARQGHAKEARECLKEMKETGIATNLVLFNALIANFLDLEHSEEALEFFELIKQEGLHPDAITLTINAKTCAKVRCLDRGKYTHTEATKLGYEKDDFVVDSLVDMYCKCGSLLDAQKLFDELRVQDILAWTILISGYGEHGYFKAAEGCLEQIRERGLPVTATTWNTLIAAYFEEGLSEEAISCFERMQFERVAPNSATYINVLKSCTALGSYSRGKEIHIQIIKEGFENDPFLSPCLIDLYAQCGTLSEAKKVFLSLPRQDEVIWSTLIGALAEHGLVFECLNSLQVMQKNGVSPNALAFAHCLKVCNSAGELILGQILYFQILGQGCERDEFLGSILISMYLMHDLLHDAHSVLNSLDMEDVCSWNALIYAYAERGCWTMVMGCLSKMQQHAVYPGASTYAFSLKGGDSMVGVAACQQIHAEIAKDGFEKDLYVGNALIDIYSRYEFFAEAHDVLHEMPIHDVDSWTALIAGYAQCMLGNEALTCFKRMQLEGFCPKHVTFVWGLKACGGIGDVGQGYGMHGEILELGLEEVPFLGNALIEMYNKCGFLLEAQRIFDILPSRNVVSWNIIITGCVESGSYEAAIDTAKRMQVECLSMDGATVVAILKACMNFGALHMGQVMHAEVAKRGFENDYAVSSSLVDLYVKGGLLKEACQVFQKLHVKDVLSWTTLISGYACQGNCEGVLGLFRNMKDTGIFPDGVTCLIVLTVCSHSGLVHEGGDHWNFFDKEMGVIATLEHYNCLIDLLARAGQLLKASALIKCLPLQPNAMSWITMLGACRKWRVEGLGELVYAYTLELV